MSPFAFDWLGTKWWGKVLLRTYDRYFAEFLNEGSLVHLGLLDLFTCVGLRYGCHNPFPARRREDLEVFLGGFSI